MKQILILEDSPAISKSVAAIASEFGNIYAAGTLEIAEELSDKHRFDIAVVDRTLPDGDGIEFVAYLHDCSPQTKILVSSDLSGLTDRLQGWREGADDYVAKPVAREELRLRLQRLFNWERKSDNEAIEFGGMLLDSDTGLINFHGKTIQLRLQELRILLLFLRHRTQLLRREDIITSVWGSRSAPTATTIDVYIRRIRVKLKQTPLHITCVRGFGYRLQLVKSS